MAACAAKAVARKRVVKRLFIIVVVRVFKQGVDIRAAGVVGEASGFRVVFDLAFFGVPVNWAVEALGDSREAADVKGACADGGRTNRGPSGDDRVEPVLTVVIRAVGAKFVG